jgi:acetate kinase
MDAVFVLNCGSSSIKFQLIQPESRKVLLKGLAENLNTDRAILKSSRKTVKLDKTDYRSALSAIVKVLDNHTFIAIGHRVVHGGEAFNTSQKITPDVLKVIENCNHLAPLHNPINAVSNCNKRMVVKHFESKGR